MKIKFPLIILMTLMGASFIYGQGMLEEVDVNGTKIIIYDNHTWKEKPVLMRYTLASGMIINIYSDHTWDEAKDVQVGERMGTDGIVGYILQEGDDGYDPSVQHGLIVRIDAFGDAFQWYCDEDLYLAEAYSEMDGLANSKAIKEKCGNSLPPATQCLAVGEEDEWYLPSMMELSKINLSIGSLAGIQKAKYWSSTIIQGTTPTQAYAVDFSENNGNAVGTPTNEAHYYFPVKKF